MTSRKRTAHRIARVQDPVIPIVGKLIREHPGTISLGQGIVHYDPPSTVSTALAADSQSIHRYGDVCGNSELLSLIELKLSSENRIAASTSAIVYTAGSNMGFLNAILASH